MTDDPFPGTTSEQEFIDGYVACALWSSLDEAGHPLDDSYGPDDIAEESLESMKDDCVEFIAANCELLTIYVNSGHTMSDAGHDFWLTRNGHGAGFWDRGLDETGDRLTSESDAYGSCDLYVGSDERLHLM